MPAAKENEKNEEYGRAYKDAFTRIDADFQCSVCGAIFTTDEDRKQHLEKEAHGELREDTTPEEMETAKEQEEYNESHRHRI
jgi:uncharacterized C2H2 Zn-finger protein